MGDEHLSLWETTTYVCGRPHIYVLPTDLTNMQIYIYRYGHNFHLLKNAKNAVIEINTQSIISQIKLLLHRLYS